LVFDAKSWDLILLNLLAKVWCPAQKRDEAISVMVINFISQLGDGAIVMQELHASILVSSLVRRGIRPNFVEIYETFPV